MDVPRIILATMSPRRQELFTYLGLPFEMLAANIDETPLSGETAEQLVIRLSSLKAELIARLHPAAFVIGADTTVAFDFDSPVTEIFEKPKDTLDAIRILRRLSGRAHQVLTAISFRSETQNVRRSVVVKTEVVFRTLQEAEIERYVASGEPMDKAGAYAIQGLGGIFISRIHGSYSNVVGLPLVELQQELSELLQIHEFPLTVTQGG